MNYCFTFLWNAESSVSWSEKAEVRGSLPEGKLTSSAAFAAQEMSFAAQSKGERGVL